MADLPENSTLQLVPAMDRAVAVSLRVRQWVAISGNMKVEIEIIVNEVYHLLFASLTQHH